MNLNELLSVLSETLSGTRAKDCVSRIAAHHRIQGSPGFLDALEEIKKALDSLDVPNKVHTFPADGESKTFAWTAPLAWHVRDGTLRQTAPQEKTLIRFEEIPQGILAQSKGGHIEAEVVDVEGGDSDAHYRDKNITGKFIMATGRPQEVAPLAVERGAVGVILYPTSKRADRWPDLVQYAGFWPDAEKVETTPLGFSISRRQADELRATLKKGAVRLLGTIDADLGPGSLHVLEGWIPGNNPEAKEVLLIAHLCHPRPSANDNASGSGLLWEIAQTLVSLRQSQRIHAERTVRFLWVPEFYGTLPWAAAYRDRLKNTLFVLNLDMVGQSPERLGEPFHVWRVPNSIPSFLNAWFEPLLDRIGSDSKTIAPGGTRRPMQWRLDPMSGGSDHLVFLDPLFRIPAVMFNHDDPLHHTHLDNLEMVDPTQLKRIGVLTTALALLPDIVVKERPRLTGWLLRYNLRELMRAFDLSLEYDDATLLNLALDVEKARVDSFRRLLAERSIQWDDAEYRQALTAVQKRLLDERDAAKSPKNFASVNNERRPKKAFEGPLPYRALRALSTEDRRFFEEEFSDSYGAMPIEVLNLCDGTRAVHEIALQVTLEFNTWISEETVSRALTILASDGWVSL
jgi:aminopeptidase-like protein